jgi:hypothetical protein
MISKFIFLNFFSFQFIKAIVKKQPFLSQMAQQVFWEEFHSKYFNGSKESSVKPCDLSVLE